ncbi:hypothetical protein AAEX28_15935 [Lentisphaerota bacterium WC36G]|nr:hypothetical protein LJT99_02695 [Lentisphaerae bacterium WC36]
MKQNKVIILSIIFMLIVILCLTVYCQKSSLKLLYIKYRLNKITNATQERDAFISIGDLRGFDIGCKYYDSKNNQVYRTSHFFTDDKVVSNPYWPNWYNAVEKLEFYDYDRGKSIFYTNFFDKKNLIKLYSRD